MTPSDLTLANLCLSSETDALGFDYIDDGIKSGTGVWWGLKRGPDNDQICFRGSELFVNGVLQPDWFRDFRGRMIPVAGLGRVHAGMYDNMPAVVELIKPMLRAKPVFTGHSLGAARTSYAAAMIGDFAQLTIFGCPRPGDQEFADLFNGKPVLSGKNRHDPITDLAETLPFAPWIDLTKFTHYDGMVDHSMGPLIEDHHIANYVKGIENAQPNTSR